MQEYWGNPEIKEKENFVKYVNKKYAGKDIVSLKIFEGYSVNPFLQIKFMENGSIHDHRIRLNKLPQYCFK